MVVISFYIPQDEKVSNIPESSVQCVPCRPIFNEYKHGNIDCLFKPVYSVHLENIICNYSRLVQ